MLPPTGRRERERCCYKERSSILRPAMQKEDATPYRKEGRRERDATPI